MIVEQEIISKILSIEYLPSYEEVLGLQKLMWANMTEESLFNPWFDFCARREVFQVLNVEFVDALADELRKFGAVPLIEICAGNGKLSYHLSKKGISIVATDDYSWELSDGEYVQRATHMSALMECAPRVVVGSWIPYKSRIGFDVLDFGVDYFVDIGESIGNATWMTNEVYSRHDYEMGSLSSVQRFSTCRTDTIDFPDHSCVTLFRRR